MQAAGAVCVLVDVREPEAGLELAADLLVERVGELHAIVAAHGFRIQRRIFERVERQAAHDGRFVLADDVVDAVVQSAEQDASRLEHAPALAKDGADVLNIAV